MFWNDIIVTLHIVTIFYNFKFPDSWFFYYSTSLMTQTTPAFSDKVLTLIRSIGILHFPYLFQWRNLYCSSYSNIVIKFFLIFGIKINQLSIVKNWYEYLFINICFDKLAYKTLNFLFYRLKSIKRKRIYCWVALMNCWHRVNGLLTKKRQMRI